MVYNKVSLDEIASLTDEQLIEVYFRLRDKYGKLKRKTLIPKRDASVGSFKTIFYNAKRWQTKKWKGKAVIDGKLFQGYTEEEIGVLWEKWLDENPRLKNPRMFI